MEVPHWEARAAAKRADILARIPPEWTLSAEVLERASQQRDIAGEFIREFLLDEREVSIVSMDSLSILEKIKERTSSATEVAKAFCKRAAVAHQMNNCLHEIFFDQALKRAEYLDRYSKENNTTIGPLHGLPISLKDQFHVKGQDTTMGYVGWIGGNLGVTDPDRIHRVESQIVGELLSLGAVLYCKTSVPQTLLFGETKNNIIGETLNPHNRNLSCGGSTGGEGALQALGGSCLGVGTDIGGSVRIPAAFCGVFSLKPTPERISYRDAANTNPGQNTYRSTVGFLSTSLGGLELILQSILSTKPWLRDPAVVPLPFRADIMDRVLSRTDRDGRAKPSAPPLKLGILWTDGVVGPHPSILRGLRTVVDAARKAGHRVVDWDPPSHETAVEIHTSFLRADGWVDVDTNLKLSGEPLIPELGDILRRRSPASMLDYQQNTIRGLAYEAAYSDYWNATADVDGQIVDAVIMPVAPHAAVIPGKFYHVGYTEAINLLNYSVVVIPVTKASKDLDPVDPSYETLNKIDKLNWEAYDPDIYDGAPVGVQIVGRKFEEEKVLAIAKIIHSLLQEGGAVTAVLSS